jgi:hypothetical protein
LALYKIACGQCGLKHTEKYHVFVLINKHGYYFGNELLLTDEDLIFRMLDPEHGGTKILRNVYNCSPENKASFQKYLNRQQHRSEDVLSDVTYNVSRVPELSIEHSYVYDVAWLMNDKLVI